eukprot:SM000315S11888  [mRNA]  locus=s315:108481:110034:+ [translate_table: standard]
MALSRINRDIVRPYSLSDDSHYPLQESLPSLAATCRYWRDVLADPAPWARVFARTWALRRVVGAPSSTAFWRGSLPQFAWSHRVSRLDSVAGLAIKYNVQHTSRIQKVLRLPHSMLVVAVVYHVYDLEVHDGMGRLLHPDRHHGLGGAMVVKQLTDIRRLNSMISDHGIHSRERLLIPVSDAADLDGREAFVELDQDARREVAVLYPDDGGEEASAAAARARAKAEQRLRAKLVATLRKSLGVDDGTAAYYLALSGGSVKGAYADFLEDLQWERERREARAMRSNCSDRLQPAP